MSNLAKITTKKKKRLGRGLGSKKGAKSGRGTTRHQKARGSIPLHFEGGQSRMVKKFPLLRGKGRNKTIKQKPFVLNVASLNIFKNGDVVNRELLIKKGLIKTGMDRRIKILGTGIIEKRLTIKLPVSRSAKELIEKAGGKIEI